LGVLRISIWLILLVLLVVTSRSSPPEKCLTLSPAVEASPDGRSVARLSLLLRKRCIPVVPVLVHTCIMRLGTSTNQD